MMKLYFYKQTPSPVKRFFFQYAVVGATVVDDDTCEGLGMQGIDFPEQPVGAYLPVATKVAGEWVASWEVTTQELRATEDKATKARIKRERLLSESDWTQLGDSPVDTNAWANYRQALRDIPGQVDFPNTIIWPEKP